MRGIKRLVVAVAVGSMALSACGSGTTADEAPASEPAASSAAAAASEEAPASEASGEAPKIGVINITETHGYQQILKAGYEAQGAAMGAEVVFCTNDLDPGKTVSCAENLLSSGVQALIVAPADAASFKAVVQLAKEKGVPVINDGSPQEVSPDFIPFTGTDNYAGGVLAGEWAGAWINENLGGKATVAELTLPAFTDCVKRNEGFLAGLQSVIPDATIAASADGEGQRAKALPAMENILQGQPDVDVVFACNDDSALGAASALTSAGKDPAKTLVLGFDGTEEAFKAVQEDGMIRLDIVQRPDCYSRRAMENAVKLVKGEVTQEELVADGLYLVATPVVTAENVEAWLQWDGTPETAPEQCVRSEATS